jgi:PRTRC genetic system protein E
MSLFKELEKLVDGQDLSLHISKKEENLIVTILPKPKVKDEAKDNLIPIVLKGTAEELDNHMKGDVLNQLKETNESSINLSEFEKSKQKFDDENKAKKEIADKKKKEVEKKEKALDKCDEYIKTKDFDKAEFLIEDLLKLDPKNKKGIKAKEELEKVKPKQVSMFDIIEEESKVSKPNTLQQVDPNTKEKIGEQVDCSGDKEQEIIEEEIEQDNSPVEEETDEEIKDALINFDIQEKSKENVEFNPIEEEHEFWAEREYRNQQEQMYNNQATWK